MASIKRSQMIKKLGLNQKKLPTTTTIPGLVQFQQWNPQSQNNYAYAPVLFDNEQQLLKVEAKLKENNIIPRRYFYPSLDTLDYLQSNQACSISRGIAGRILCLPIYPGLSIESQEMVTATIGEALNG